MAAPEFDSIALLRDAFGPAFDFDQAHRACLLLYEDNIAREGLPLKPGVRELLDDLAARKIPLGVATSTRNPAAAQRLERVGLLAVLFRPCHRRPGFARQTGPGHLSRGRPPTEDRRRRQLRARGFPRRRPLRACRRAQGHHGARSRRAHAGNFRARPRHREVASRRARFIPGGSATDESAGLTLIYSSSSTRPARSALQMPRFVERINAMRCAISGWRNFCSSSFSACETFRSLR